MLFGAVFLVVRNTVVCGVVFVVVIVVVPSSMASSQASSSIIVHGASHYRMVLDVNTRKRIFTQSTALYRCLQSNKDVTELIASKVQTMCHQEAFKSLQAAGREANKNLRTMCLTFHDTIGWDQDTFELGFEFITETFYERIPEDVKGHYLAVIEEAFYTMPNRHHFHKFIRDAAEGSINTKNNFRELLSDLIKGADVARMLEQLS